MTENTPDELDWRLHENLYAVIVWAHSSCNRDLIHTIGELELSFSEILLLEELRGRTRPPTIGQVAGMLNMSHPGACRVVDQLVRRGLVDRDRDDRDLRRRRVTITERGEERVLELHRARIHGLERLERELDDEQKRQLVDALEILVQRADVAACRARNSGASARRPPRRADT